MSASMTYHCWYEGRSINKLHSDAVFNFQIWKMRKMLFVGNIILSRLPEFCYNYVIIWRHFHLENKVSLCSILSSGFLSQLVLNSISSYEKMNKFKKANLFKQVLLFGTCFSFFAFLPTNRPNAFKHLYHLSRSYLVCTWMRDAIKDAGCGQVVPPQQHFLDNDQISYTKHVFVISWNIMLGASQTERICTECFCPQKTNNWTLFLIRDAFIRSVVLHNDY